MRKKPTPAEAKLWDAVRAQRLGGHNFRRQHPIGPFYVDFLVPDAKLIVELDGPIHDFQREYDARRQSYLESGGFRVIRFTNDQVMKELDSVLAILTAAVAERNDLRTNKSQR
jgi:very-short-patch-repair endonuclease